MLVPPPNDGWESDGQNHPLQCLPFLSLSDISDKDGRTFPPLPPPSFPLRESIRHETNQSALCLFTSSAILVRGAGGQFIVLVFSHSFPSAPVPRRSAKGHEPHFNAKVTFLHLLPSTSSSRLPTYATVDFPSFSGMSLYHFHRTFIGKRSRSTRAFNTQYVSDRCFARFQRFFTSFPILFTTTTVVFPWTHLLLYRTGFFRYASCGNQADALASLIPQISLLFSPLSAALSGVGRVHPALFLDPNASCFASTFLPTFLVLHVPWTLHENSETIGFNLGPFLSPTHSGALQT